MQRNQRIVLIATVLIATIGGDLATKQIAERALVGAGRISLLGDFLRLEYVMNTGAFLSLGVNLSASARFWLFVVLVPLVLAAILVMAVVDRKLDRLQIVSLTLMVAGGVGNLIDRIWLGSVRDFLNIGVGSLRTGVFNVADMAITFGAIAFLLSQFRRDRNRTPTTDAR